MAQRGRHPLDVQSLPLPNERLRLTIPPLSLLLLMDLGFVLAPADVWLQRAQRVGPMPSTLQTRNDAASLIRSLTATRNL